MDVLPLPISLSCRTRRPSTARLLERRLACHRSRSGQERHWWARLCVEEARHGRQSSLPATDRRRVRRQRALLGRTTTACPPSAMAVEPQSLPRRLESQRTARMAHPPRLTGRHAAQQPQHAHTEDHGLHQRGDHPDRFFPTHRRHSCGTPMHRSAIPRTGHLPPR